MLWGLLYSLLKTTNLRRTPLSGPACRLRSRQDLQRADQGYWHLHTFHGIKLNGIWLIHLTYPFRNKRPSVFWDVTSVICVAFLPWCHGALECPLDHAFKHVQSVKHVAKTSRNRWTIERCFQTEPPALSTASRRPALETPQCQGWRVSGKGSQGVSMTKLFLNQKTQRVNLRSFSQPLRPCKSYILVRCLAFREIVKAKLPNWVAWLALRALQGHRSPTCSNWYEQLTIFERQN
jgi:hypothetical protein